MISNIYSRASLEEKESPRMWTLSKKFMEKFASLTEQCGSTNCSDIAQVDWSDKDAVREYYTNPESNRRICIKLVGEAAFTLGELLEEET